MGPEAVTSAMEFGSPEHLVWIWLVPVALGVMWFAERRRKARLRMVGALMPGRPLEVSSLRTITKWTMIALGLTCLIIALAKPRWGYDWIDAKQRGADIMIAVDVSKSMMAPDVSPSRLERARRKVSDLLERMNGDRVGLVAFAGTAFVQCPLTMDYSAVRLFLSYLDPELIPTQGTDLGNAIDVSLAGLFDGAPEDADNGRAIIIMTDGEDLEGRGQQAAAAAKAKGVKVYTLAIGSDEGSLIPEAGGGFLKDRNGDLVISKPNEPTLRAVAQASGGAYVRSVASDADLKVLYDQGILNDVTRSDLQDVRTKRWHERFQWFLAAAFFFLFSEPLLRDVRFRGVKKTDSGKKSSRALTASLLFFSLIWMDARPALAASMGSAHDHYKKKEYEAAAKEFSALEKETPDNPELTYNRAVSQFRSGDFAAAAEGFGRAAGAKDPGLQEKSWYNLGNSLAYQQKFKEAIKAYENTLQVNPENLKAQENLAAVKRLLEQQEQQKQQSKNQDSQQQEDQNEQKQDQQQDQENQESQQAQNQQDQQQGEQARQQDQQAEQDQQAGKSQGQDQQDPQNQAAEQPGDQKNDKEPEPGDQAKEGQQKEEQAANDTQDKSNHNQDDQNDSEQQQSQAEQAANQPPAQQYSKDKALELLRSVQDQIGKYRYMDPAGQTQPKDPEKAW